MKSNLLILSYPPMVALVLTNSFGINVFLENQRIGGKNQIFAWVHMEFNISLIDKFMYFFVTK